ncbi:hypothetical protein [Planobispora longispora]|uniref:Uncharacterized protein n=1 Tax=Planobispora longispora TaxID=28887 RepID=A0A8J3W6A9_9ACTN|nr:hypothetical protein [Planobispora longispora]BFE83763.1 hypothetical protein GCM10020093_063640 [Planobispora longispora]GIH78304.1 hypothetical protein Plo01_47330 [Planobispora longispora]
MDIALVAVFLGLILSIATLALFVVLVAVIRAEDRRHAPTGALSHRLLGTYAHRCPPAACTGRR